MRYGIIFFMETNIIELSQSLKIGQKQVEKVLELTAEGNTIPFIARYRKEMTGNLDEVEIKAILDLDKSLTNRSGYSTAQSGFCRHIKCGHKRLWSD
ncbi:Uncharacterised protein [Streptococcus constellatus]|uniref:Tex-like protein N-terminal domain-containing protein n=1 Tax=Streptococcus constellatus TaxID=76860 RepID=A0A564TVR6_STRCV|nr:Uncharacterised protein [Streptococcus constellatus]